ncbi:hypothetical protein AZ17_2082 [Bordetella bronchiseptica D989]|nr:hypothetical protein AZ17_2082 [Bordetella bronchiseptica D989]
MFAFTSARRRALQAVAAMGVAALLAACGESAPAFKGSDITGTQLGKKLALVGRRRLVVGRGRRASGKRQAGDGNRRSRPSGATHSGEVFDHHQTLLRVVGDSPL